MGKKFEQLIASATSIHVVDDAGHTPLHVASLKGNRDVVELLIANRHSREKECRDAKFRVSTRMDGNA